MLLLVYSCFLPKFRFVYTHNEHRILPYKIHIAEYFLIGLSLMSRSFNIVKFFAISRLTGTDCPLIICLYRKSVCFRIITFHNNAISILLSGAFVPAKELP